MTAVQIAPGPLGPSLERTRGRAAERRLLSTIWARRPDAWTTDPGVAATIANRLGWLDALDFVEPQLDRLTAAAEQIRTSGFARVVLLGMGGSSLAPEVVRRIIGVTPGFPQFRMLDSVDPDAVRQAMDDVGSSLFVVASKSGSTIEPTVMALEAQRRLIAAGHADWGARMIAITDEGSTLHRQAIAERFREVFVNPSDIGGRYSALSYFGLVPAALMGIDVRAIVGRARVMVDACKADDPASNPGLALGMFMAAAAAAGRDKLVLAYPDRWQALGLWTEQLVAESTGKQGVGIVPIVDPQGAPADAADAAVILVHEAGAVVPPVPLDRPAAAWSLESPHQLGAEFFRWEMATAVAGALMDVNPFDEPNVQQAKDATRSLLRQFEAQRRLPSPTVHASVAGVRVTLSAAAESRLAGRSPLGLIDLIGPGDYVGLLVFAPPDDPTLDPVLTDFLRTVSARAGCASTLGYGPRYLHSTGQLHKGGRNNGVFVVVATEAVEDLPIPTQPFSFAVLAAAQALGDFESLDRTGRRAVLLQLPSRSPEAIAGALSLLLTQESGR